MFYKHWQNSWKLIVDIFLGILIGPLYRIFFGDIHQGKITKEPFVIFMAPSIQVPESFPWWLFENCTYDLTLILQTHKNLWSSPMKFNPIENEAEREVKLQVFLQISL